MKYFELLILHSFKAVHMNLLRQYTPSGALTSFQGTTITAFLCFIPLSFFPSSAALGLASLLLRCLCCLLKAAAGCSIASKQNSIKLIANRRVADIMGKTFLMRLLGPRAIRKGRGCTADN